MHSLTFSGLAIPQVKCPKNFLHEMNKQYGYNTYIRQAEGRSSSIFQVCDVISGDHPMKVPVLSASSISTSRKTV